MSQQGHGNARPRSHVWAQEQPVCAYLPRWVGVPERNQLLDDLAATVNMLVDLVWTSRKISLTSAGLVCY